MINKGTTMINDELLFVPKENNNYFRVLLIVYDDFDVHSITKLALQGYFFSKPRVELTR